MARLDGIVVEEEAEEALACLDETGGESETLGEDEAEARTVFLILKNLCAGICAVAKAVPKERRIILPLDNLVIRTRDTSARGKRQRARKLVDRESILRDPKMTDVMDAMRADFQEVLEGLAVEFNPSLVYDGIMKILRAHTGGVAGDLEALIDALDGMMKNQLGGSQKDRLYGLLATLKMISTQVNNVYDQVLEERTAYNEELGSDFKEISAKAGKTNARGGGQRMEALLSAVIATPNKFLLSPTGSDIISAGLDSLGSTSYGRQLSHETLFSPPYSQSFAALAYFAWRLKLVPAGPDAAFFKMNILQTRKDLEKLGR